MVVGAYARPYENVRNNIPTHRGNRYVEGRRRSSFGGSSFHDSRSNVGFNNKQHGHDNRLKYAVSDGHAYGAHSGEYFIKESNSSPNQHHRRPSNY